MESESNRQVRRQLKTQDRPMKPPARYALTTQYQSDIVEEANNPVGPAIEIWMTKEKAVEIIRRWFNSE